MDDDGWFHADEDTINAVDNFLSWEDDEYAHQLITFEDARIALARARIARGFYPVVAPAHIGNRLGATTSFRPPPSDAKRWCAKA